MAISLLSLEPDYIYKYFKICLVKLCLLLFNVIKLIIYNKILILLYFYIY